MSGVFGMHGSAAACGWWVSSSSAQLSEGAHMKWTDMTVTLFRCVYRHPPQRCCVNVNVCRVSASESLLQYDSNLEVGVGLGFKD